MGLYIATVSEVTRQGYDLFGGTGERLLNTNRINDLGVNNTTGSIFDYSIGLKHDREPSCNVKTTDTAASVVVDADIEYTNNLITLSEYPDRNLSESTQAIYVNTADIVVAEAFTSYTWLVLVKGGLFEKIYVTQALADIIDEAVVVGDGLLGEDDGVLLGEDDGILLPE